MKIESHDKVIDFKEDENKKIEKIKNILNNDDFLREVARVLIPGLAHEDKHGHSSFLPSLRLHPAFYLQLVEQYDKVNAIVKKYPHRSDYLRYLLSIGFVVDKWLNEIVDEEASEMLRHLYEINKYWTKLNLTNEAREYAEKTKELRSGDSTKIQVEDIVKKLEKIF